MTVPPASPVAPVSAAESCTASPMLTELAESVVVIDGGVCPLRSASSPSADAATTTSSPACSPSRASTNSDSARSTPLTSRHQRACQRTAARPYFAGARSRRIRQTASASARLAVWLLRGGGAERERRVAGGGRALQTPLGGAPDSSSRTHVL